MITPQQMVDAVIKKINDNLATLGIMQVAEGSEDTKNEQLKPPYCLVYANFEEDALITDSGAPIRIPVTIGIAIVSTEHKTVAESFSQVFTIAYKLIQTIQGDYDIDGYNGDESTVLKCQDIPIRIGVKSAAISSVICLFKYEIDLIVDGYGN